MTSRHLAAAGALGLAVALAGCTAASAPPPEAAAEVDLTSAQEDCLADVRPKVEAAQAPSELVAPEAPLDLAALEGDTVWFITVTMNQFSSDMADGVQEAVDAAGMDLVTFDGQGTANRFTEGIEQAVAQEAAGIILVGIDPNVVSAALARAEAAGIPVQNTLNGDVSDDVPAGMYTNLTSDFTADGALAADWALADSGCAANMVVLYSSSIAVWENLALGAEAEMAAVCPECPVTLLEVDVANVATDVGSQLQTALQRDPDITHIYPVWDSAVTFVTPVLSAAGSDAKIISRDGLDANIEMIMAGDQAMTIAMPTTGWIGWIAFDSLARAVLGDEDPRYEVPTQLVDTSTVGDGSSEHIWPNFVGYQQAFQDAWSQS